MMLGLLLIRESIRLFYHEENTAAQPWFAARPTATRPLRNLDDGNEFPIMRAHCVFVTRLSDDTNRKLASWAKEIKCAFPNNSVERAGFFKEGDSFCGKR